MVSQDALGQHTAAQNCHADGVPVFPGRATICGVIVTYEPDSEFLSRAQRLITQVAQVVVVDNASSGSCTGQLTELAGTAVKVHLILNHRNAGVARALNQGIQWAAAQGFGWVLTLDQDTLVERDMVESLCRVYHALPDQAKLALIGSNYIDSVIRRPFLASNGDKNQSWVEVKTTITSGSLVSLSAYRVVGPFREEFFIDGVDFEYCLRARSKGFRVIMTRKPLMQHRIGLATRHRLPWKTTGTSNHSPVRRYYMVRNQLVLAREYFWSEPAWTISTLYRYLKDVVLFCLFERDVARKLKFTGMGALDGLLSNFKRSFD